MCKFDADIISLSDGGTEVASEGSPSYMLQSLLWQLNEEEARIVREAVYS